MEAGSDFDSVDHIVLPNESTQPLLRELGLSLIVPFYNEEQRLRLQLANWSAYNDLVKNTLQIIIVDDGSIPFMSSVIPKSIEKRMELNLTIYRIVDDIKWNTPGALNLGITQAKTDWVLIMDSDCLIEPDNMFKLITELRPEKLRTYCFMRNRITDDPIKKARVTPPTCAILMHKDAYEQVGGFDEDFVGTRSGGYGFFDVDFQDRLWVSGHQRTGIADIFIKEYLKDVESSVQERTGCTEDSLKINKRLLRAKQMGKTPRSTERLRFTWVKDYEKERW